MTTTVAAPTDTASPQPPSPAELFVAALDLRAFTGRVGLDQLRAMLASAGMASEWLTGSRWALLSRLWTAQTGAADCVAAITTWSEQSASAAG